MTKKYEHKPPYKKDELVKLREANAKLTRELDTLQTALRMLTNTDKDILMKAVEIIKIPIDINTWYTTPIVTTTPTQYFTSPIITTTDTITIRGTTTT